MFLTPNSRIIIGAVRFESLHEIVINRSVKDFENKATITLPRNFTKRGDKGVTDFIHRGDSVTVELGYNGQYFTEFKGYVDIIGSSAPLIIECDGEWYNHKKNELVPKTIESASLKSVLTYAFPNYTIDCPDANIGTFMIGKVSSFEVINAIKNTVGFYAKIDDVLKLITCYYAFEPKINTKHTYVFGTRDEIKLNALQSRNLFPNVKKNDLKFERKDDVKLSMTAKAKKRDGTSLSVKIGSNDPSAEKRSRNYGYEITSEAQLREVAEKDLKRMVFDGYSGTITGFGYPRVNAGDSMIIIDPENSEREGTYLVEKTTLRHSVNLGYERVCTLSYKI